MYNGVTMKLRYLSPQLLYDSPNLSKDAEKRLSWIDWYIGHNKNARYTCRHFGISPDTFYLWKNKFNPKDLTTLEDDKNTRRPHRVREMTTPKSMIDMIIKIRKNDMEKSKYEIQEELKRLDIHIGTSTIQKIINRKGLLNTQHIQNIRRKRLKSKIHRIKAPKKAKYQYPGSLIQIDTKHIKILNEKYYVFSAIDTNTRIGYTYPYTSITSKSGADFIERVKRYLPFNINAIQTDNGSEYMKEFHDKCISLNIQHYFIDPQCPKQNGNVERFIQTLTYEHLNYEEDLMDKIDDIRDMCNRFNDKYNTRRFHMSLGYKTPLEYLQESKLVVNLH